MALEDITRRIVSAAQQEADALLSQAQQRADDLKREAAERLAHEIVSAEQRAVEEAAARHARLTATAQLEGRKQELAARRALVSSAVDQALARLAKADEETYAAFLLGILLQAPFEGEADILVSAKDRDLLQRRLSHFQRELDRAGRGLTLRPSPETREIDGGFVLRQGRIEYNASLAAIKRFREHDLRAAANEALFGEDA
ncbi:hypothetical protein JXA88_15010 [Candidatus Fermentibacteria bacterium]|nr:hypothetical protein [Candidatus Fermentibacteria bacterium]